MMLRRIFDSGHLGQKIATQPALLVLYIAHVPYLYELKTLSYDRTGA
jgi:malonyl CoA-acyl carrier protein transacylase